MKYYRMVCPRCGKEYAQRLRKFVPLNCGDCLMDRTEVVEMECVSVKPEIKEGADQ